MRVSRLLARILNKFRLLPSFSGETVIGINNKKFIVPLLGGQVSHGLRWSVAWQASIRGRAGSDSPAARASNS